MNTAVVAIISIFGVLGVLWILASFAHAIAGAIASVLTIAVAGWIVTRSMGE